MRRSLDLRVYNMLLDGLRAARGRVHDLIRRVADGEDVRTGVVEVARLLLELKTAARVDKQVYREVEAALRAVTAAAGDPGRVAERLLETERRLAMAAGDGLRAAKTVEETLA